MRELSIPQVSLRNKARGGDVGRQNKMDKPDMFFLRYDRCTDFHVFIITEQISLHVLGPIFAKHLPYFGADVVYGIPG